MALFLWEWSTLWFPKSYYLKTEILKTLGIGEGGINLLGTFLTFREWDLIFVAAVVHKSHKASQPLANGLKSLKHQLELEKEVPFNWASKMLYL